MYPSNESAGPEQDDQSEGSTSEDEAENPLPRSDSDDESTEEEQESDIQPNFGVDAEDNDEAAMSVSESDGIRVINPTVSDLFIESIRENYLDKLKSLMAEHSEDCFSVKKMPDGESPIIYAINANHSLIAVHLIQNGYLEDEASSDESALMRAIEMNNTLVFSHLLEISNLNHVSSTGNSPLTCALRTEDRHFLQELLKHSDKIDLAQSFAKRGQHMVRYLDTAICFASVHEIKQLIETGVPVRNGFLQNYLSSAYLCQVDFDVIQYLMDTPIFGKGKRVVRPGQYSKVDANLVCYLAGYRKLSPEVLLTHIDAQIKHFSLNVFSTVDEGWSAFSVLLRSLPLDLFHNYVRRFDPKQRFSNGDTFAHTICRGLEYCQDIDLVKRLSEYLGSLKPGEFPHLFSNLEKRSAGLMPYDTILIEYDRIKAIRAESELELTSKENMLTALKSFLFYCSPEEPLEGIPLPIKGILVDIKKKHILEPVFCPSQGSIYKTDLLRDHYLRMVKFYLESVIEECLSKVERTQQSSILCQVDALIEYIPLLYSLKDRRASKRPPHALADVFSNHRNITIYEYPPQSKKHPVKDESLNFWLLFTQYLLHIKAALEKVEFDLNQEQMHGYSASKDGIITHQTINKYKTFIESVLLGLSKREFPDDQRTPCLLLPMPCTIGQLYGPSNRSKRSFEDIEDAEERPAKRVRKATHDRLAQLASILRRRTISALSRLERFSQSAAAMPESMITGNGGMQFLEPLFDELETLEAERPGASDELKLECDAFLSQNRKLVLQAYDMDVDRDGLVQDAPHAQGAIPDAPQAEVLVPETPPPMDVAPDNPYPEGVVPETP